jgi:hypothetical protein
MQVISPKSPNVRVWAPEGARDINPHSVEGIPVIIIVFRLCLVNVRMVDLEITPVFELIPRRAPVSEFI